MSLLEKVIWWLGVDFLLALVPLLVHAYTGGRGGWHAAIGHGELMLVACGISGITVVTAATVETQNPRLRELRAFVGVLGLVALLATGLTYATVAAEVASGQTGNVLAPSYVLTVGALVIGFAGIFLSTKAEAVTA